MGIIAVGGTENGLRKGSKMLGEAQTVGETDGDYVEFIAAGMRARGDYRCSGCGYGVNVHAELPTCPMCGGTSWEQSAWSPLTRAQRLQ
jgi:rubredoxin